MKNFLKLQSIIIFVCCLVCSSSIVAATKDTSKRSFESNLLFIDSQHPPPGFESIHMNQHLRVSVLFMHQYVGFFYIDIKQGQLTFHSPESLLAQLGGIKKNKSALHLLSQSFPLNIECYPSNDIAALPNDCEELKKKPAYIIYHPEQETVYLHLSPHYFEKPKEAGSIDFMPPPNTGWSYINKLGAAGSFSNDHPLMLSRIYSSTPNYYNLYSNNTLSYGNSSVISNMSQNNGIDNGQHFQMQNLYAQHIVKDKIYMEGYIVNPMSPFVQTQTIIGAGMRTTLETIKNTDNIIATPLVIFVPQASQVSIFKNEQLIFSQYLEAGYQNINTSHFPDGGYELTIKIGASNIIHRFFTKGFFLPPKQMPQFYIIGGYLTNGMLINDNAYHFLPDILNIPVLQAGINKRINERFAVSSDILLNSQQWLVDFGPTFFLGNSFIKTAGLISTKNNYGFYAMVNTQKNRWNLNLIATKIFYQKKKPDYFFLNNLVDNDSISISYKISEHDLLGVQANYTKSLDQPHSYNAGTFYQKQIANYKGMGFFFNAAYNKAIYVGDTYSLGLSINFSEGKLAGTEALLWQDQTNNGHNNPLAVPIVVQGSTVYSHQNEQEIGYSVNEIHTLSPTVSSVAGIYNYTANPAFIATYINYNQMKDEGHSIGYGGNLETELVVKQTGAHLNGIHRGNTAGIIVKVDSSNANDTSSKFALLDANHRKIAIFPANTKVFISLPGFTDQNYTLVNLSKSDYLIKEPTRHITLYPGNIGYYSWAVEKRIIVMGRAVTKGQHSPLSNQWIHAGEKGIFSDSEGNFQLELSQNTTTLMAGDFCQMTLPKLNIDKSYLYIGDVLCS